MRKTGGKALSFTLAAVVFAASLFTPLSPFTDEAYGAHWADPYLTTLAAKNIVRGDEYGNYNPDRNITRAEFTAMINRAFGFQEDRGASFSDVEPGAWFEDDLSFASYQGYFQGTGSGTADPGGNLTREQAVTMVCRALKIESVPVDTLSFADSRAFSAWSRGYINASTEKGMITGYGDNTFRPQNPITRGEVAKLLTAVGGEIVNQPTQAYAGYVDGNVTLSKSGAGLRNTVITGDLFITEGVLSGYVFLEDVTVLGTVYISGAGETQTAESSIVFDNCEINGLIVDLNHGKKVSIIAQGDTVINNTVVKSDAYFEENNARRTAFNDIQMKGPSGTVLDLSGEFAEIRLMATGNEVNLNRGRIERFTADEDGSGGSLFLEKDTELDELFIDSDVDVTGTGEIHFTSVGANGANIDQIPDEIIIRPGYTVSVNGKEMNYIDAELENATPRIESGYPTVKDITANAASGQIKGNKPGTVYWAVKAEGSGTPSTDEMKDPKTDTAIVSSGNMQLALTALETELSAKVSGLQNGGTYEIFAMLVDAKGGASRVRSIGFETLDRIAPAFVTGYPKVTAESKAAVVTGGAIVSEAEHTLKIDAVATKDCTIYWIVMPENGVAPSADRLYAGSGSGGETQHGTNQARQNILTSFTVSGLGEDTPYDIYVGLRDSRGNTSAVVKLTTGTSDVTPPEFEAAYPMLGTVSERAVEIKYMTREESTLYWVLMPRGSRFPPGAPEDGTAPGATMGAIVSYWTTDAAKQAVISGNNSLQKGNVKVMAGIEGKFSVQSLSPETLYEVYLVLEDASANRSVVGKMEIATPSIAPPTARMVFDEILVPAGEDPPVGSDIMIAFNKNVGAGESNETVVELTKMPKEGLGDVVKLYKVNPVGSSTPRTEVPINFANVTVEDALGYTVIRFKTTGTGDNASPEAAAQLESGGQYYFELKNIRDLTNSIYSAMRPNTQSNTVKLSDFRMKAPFVNMRNVATVNRVYDLLFDVDPLTTSVAETLMYDNVFETDTPIRFDLYSVDYNVTNPELSDGTLIKSGLLMEPGKFFYPMQALLERAEPQIFKDLKRVRYGIVIRAINGDEERTRWDGPVKFVARGVSGSSDSMSALAFTGSRPDTDFAEFMAGGSAGDLAVVSDPTRFESVIYFQDRTAPVFVTPPSPNPYFDSGDSTIRMDVTLDKQATVYWLAAPVDSVSDPAAVTAEQLVSGSYRPDGYRSGTMNVPSGNARVTANITGLVPKPDNGESEYYVFYVARANATSEIKYEIVEMKPITIPEFYPSNGRSLEESATVITELGENSPDAVVYWAAYRSGTWPAGTMPTASELRQAGDAPDIRIADSGNFTLTRGNSPFTTTVRNLLEGVYYDVFFVARNAMSSPETAAWTDVKTLNQKITPQDLTAPDINELVTEIHNVTSDQIPKFEGVIRVSFTKPLYYKKDEYGTPMVFDETVLRDNLTITYGDIEIANVQTGANTTAVVSFDVRFKNVNHNGVISMQSCYLGDGLNDTGRFRMTFKRNSQAPEESEWVAEIYDKPRQ